MSDADQRGQAIDLNHQLEAMRLLDEERQRLGWTVRDLEAKSGVSVSSFYAWQCNVRSPHLANLVALAQTLGFDIVMRRSKVDGST